MSLAKILQVFQNGCLLSETIIAPDMLCVHCVDGIGEGA